MKKLIELDATLEGLENLNAISFYEANEHSKEAYTEVKAMLKALPSAQQIPWDRKTRNSMAGTLQMLRRLAYNIHGVMDVIDDDNVNRLIEWLEGKEDE